MSLFSFQVEDIALMNNGTLFFTCNDSVTRDSADRNIMAWDFNKAVVVSNQIYQVCIAALSTVSGCWKGGKVSETLNRKMGMMLSSEQTFVGKSCHQHRSSSSGSRGAPRFLENHAVFRQF